VVVKGDDGHRPTRRTQADRRQATRGALLRAGRELFAAQGFAGTGREEIVARAGVTRGAMYHHFESKEDLFRAVYDELEAEVMQKVALAAMATTDPKEQLRLGARAWLEYAAAPAVVRICLVDAPAVLDPTIRREISERYSVGLLREVLQACMETGEITPRPIEPLARILLAALLESATLVGEGADPREVGGLVDEMLDAL
jgi:AcrR family transcriptional regulator